uniref:Uncharacterized protein LOC103329902 n=1 Tax=Rhizophora mucronata TaxID=61149 RepID=A0A2P2MVH2_RHIMU
MQSLLVLHAGKKQGARLLGLQLSVEVPVVLLAIENQAMVFRHLLPQDLTKSLGQGRLILEIKVQWLRRHLHLGFHMIKCLMHPLLIMEITRDLLLGCQIPVTVPQEVLMGSLSWILPPVLELLLQMKSLIIMTEE